mgnify:FL=1
MSKLNLSRTYRTLVSMFGLMCLSLAIGPVWAQDDPVPFACTGDAYTVRATPAELFRIDQDVTPFQFYPIGAPLTGPFGVGGAEIPIQVNNLGYDTVENLLYAVALDANGASVNYGIIQLDSTGTVFSLGTPVGLPNNLRFVAGDISTDGNTYFINTYQSDTLYTVDLNLGDVAEVPILGGPVEVADWAYNPDDGMLYGASGEGPTAATGGEIFQLNPGTGQITSVGQPLGLPLGEAGPARYYGGAWFDANGTLFLYRNNDVIYTIDLAGPTITNVQNGGAGPSEYNDATACAAGTPVIDKFYTYTNNDWSMRCAIYELDECVEYRLPNINVDDDIFADPLPRNAEEDYVLLGKQLRRKTVINPRQYFAVSNIEVIQDQDVLVREDFSDCTDIGTVNPFSVPGGVQVVLVDASGDVYDIGGELANGNGGWIELYPTYADVYVENVPAGSTLRVMVKFQPLDELGMIGRSCTNYEILLDEEISASAVLTVEPK